MKSFLQYRTEINLHEMSYAQGGDKFEEHLFGPDYDKEGNVKKLGGTGLDGYLVHPKTGKTVGVEAGLHSKDFQQGRFHIKDGKHSHEAKNTGFKKYLDTLQLDDSKKTGLHNHLMGIYGADHQPFSRERISRSTGQTKTQNFNASGAAAFNQGETHITHNDVDDAVNTPYNEAGKHLIMIDGIGAHHTGTHGHLDVPKFGVKEDAKKGLTIRVRHKNGRGAIGLNIPKGDYVPHEPTQTREGMINHFVNQGYKFSRTPEGVKRSHLNNSGYAGPTDHLHILEDE